MDVATRLGLFVLVLSVVFAGAYGVGAVADPNPGSQQAHEARGRHDESGVPDAGGHAGGDGASGPGGLAVATDGYALRRVGSTPAAGVPSEFAFQIVDAQRRPVMGFQVSHEKRLHLIVVRSDLTGFQHLHPRLEADGVWRSPLTLPAAGVWRAFADFRPDGHDRQLILGVDVHVAGDYRPLPLPEPTTATSVDDYSIALDGHLTAGRTSRLTFMVSRNGTPVADLQAYLGAHGHLVALRAGDLAYLHVHPRETDTAGPEISFDVEVPTPAEYRLFLDFHHGGVVRTASLTATA